MCASGLACKYFLKSVAIVSRIFCCEGSNPAFGSFGWAAQSGSKRCAKPAAPPGLYPPAAEEDLNSDLRGRLSRQVTGVRTSRGHGHRSGWQIGGVQQPVLPDPVTVPDVSDPSELRMYLVQFTCRVRHRHRIRRYSFYKRRKLPPGPVTVTATCTDSRNLTGQASTQVTIRIFLLRRWIKPWRRGWLCTAFTSRLGGLPRGFRCRIAALTTENPADYGH